MKQLVLASASPSRQEILAKLGLPFKIMVSNYQEDMSAKKKPTDLAIYLSQGKAREVASRAKNSVILAADSFVIYKGQFLGKPRTATKNLEMLKRLNGQKHQFITGWTIIDSDSGQEYSNSCLSTIYLRKLTDAEMKSYIKKASPHLKAGGYDAGGLASSFISKINGDFNNIRGLPLSDVSAALKSFDVKVL